MAKTLGYFRINPGAEKIIKRGQQGTFSASFDPENCLFPYPKPLPLSNMRDD